MFGLCKDFVPWQAQKKRRQCEQPGNWLSALLLAKVILVLRVVTWEPDRDVELGLLHEETALHVGCTSSVWDWDVCVNKVIQI